MIYYYKLGPIYESSVKVRLDLTACFKGQIVR